MNPLLESSDERTIKPCRNSALKKQFSCKLGRYRRWTVGAALLREQSARDTPRELELHRPKREANAIPTEIAQAAKGLELAVGANIRRKEVRRRAETESGGNALQIANTLVLQLLSNPFQTAAVHKHHSIHELHTMMAASVEHLAEVCDRGCTRLLGDNVLSRFRSTNHPFLAQPGWQRNVNRVHIAVGQQCFIAAKGARRLSEWGFALARADKGAAAFEVPAGNGADNAIATVENGLPIFLRDFGGAEDAPAGFWCAHLHFKSGRECALIRAAPACLCESIRRWPA